MALKEGDVRALQQVRLEDRTRNALHLIRAGLGRQKGKEVKV